MTNMHTAEVNRAPASALKRALLHRPTRFLVRKAAASADNTVAEAYGRRRQSLYSPMVVAGIDVADFVVSSHTADSASECSVDDVALDCLRLDVDANRAAVIASLADDNNDSSAVYDLASSQYTPLFVRHVRWL